MGGLLHNRSRTCCVCSWCLACQLNRFTRYRARRSWCARERQLNLTQLGREQRDLLYEVCPSLGEASGRCGGRLWCGGTMRNWCCRIWCFVRWHRHEIFRAICRRYRARSARGARARNDIRLLRRSRRWRVVAVLANTRLSVFSRCFHFARRAWLRHLRMPCGIERAHERCRRGTLAGQSTARDRPQLFTCLCFDASVAFCLTYVFQQGDRTSELL